MVLDRPPLDICPTDPNKEHTWSESLGELTDVSIFSEFLLKKTQIYFTGRNGSTNQPWQTFT